MAKKRFRLHRGYAIAAIIIASVLFVGSLILFPQWSQSNSGLLVLIVIIVAGVVTFLADFRTAFSTHAESQPSSTTINQTTNRSGGTDIHAQQVSAQDIVGRDKIVYEAAAQVATSLHQLPSPPNDFTGRDAELQDLLNNIEQGAIITGLRGLGGIGKTALALVLADKLKVKYPDAQFFLNLQGASDKPLTSIDAMQHGIRAYHPTAKLPDNVSELQGLYRTVCMVNAPCLSSTMHWTRGKSRLCCPLPHASCSSHHGSIFRCQVCMVRTSRSSRPTMRAS